MSRLRSRSYRFVDKDLDWILPAKEKAADDRAGPNARIGVEAEVDRILEDSFEELYERFLDRSNVSLKHASHDQSTHGRSGGRGGGASVHLTEQHWNDWAYDAPSVVEAGHGRLKPESLVDGGGPERVDEMAEAYWSIRDASEENVASVGTLWRGESYDSLAEVEAKYRSGKNVEFDEITSTSNDREVADTYANSGAPREERTGGGRVPVILELGSSTQEHRGISTGGGFGDTGGTETILAPGSNYRVNGKPRMLEDGTVLVRLYTTVKQPKELPRTDLRMKTKTEPSSKNLALKHASHDQSTHGRSGGGGGGGSIDVDAEWEKIKNDLTLEERTSISAYTDIQYANINPLLRGQKQDFGGRAEASTARMHTRNIDSAMKKSALSDDFVLYRGMHGDGAALKPGTVFSDKAFVSTTADEYAAVNWSVTAQKRSPVQTGTVLTIRAPKGTSAVPIGSGQSVRTSDEQEVLLNRGTRFRVIGRTVEDNTFVLARTNQRTGTIVHRVEVEVIK